MTTPRLTESIGRSPLRLALLLIPLALACFALSPRAQAVSPAPDGGYAGANTAEGTNALFFLTTGTGNTATGFAVLYHNTTGIDNTASGFEALFDNTTGNDNTADGFQALDSNTTGAQNTATGAFALENNNANDNTADGFQALDRNTTGAGNTATGASALQNNNATFNTADGFQALLSNTTGASNTAVGESALKSNTTASNNTGVGFQVAFHTTGAGNTAIGEHALLNNSTGSSNIALGLNAGTNLTTGSNNIDIGNNGVAAEAGTVRIGTGQTKTFIAGIRGKTTVNANAVPVVIDSAGQLGTVSSSARFKKAVKPMAQTSEAILALKPVTFHYKSDSTGTAQFGLIAEEVAKVNPDLVVRDENGAIYTVRYEAVNAMLLNEFLKEHRTVQELKKEIAALTATVQKVTAQVEMSRPAPQTVVNNH